MLFTFFAPLLHAGSDDGGSGGGGGGIGIIIVGGVFCVGVRRWSWGDEKETSINESLTTFASLPTSGKKAAWSATHTRSSPGTAPQRGGSAARKKSAWSRRSCTKASPNKKNISFPLRQGTVGREFGGKEGTRNIFEVAGF